MVRRFLKRVVVPMWLVFLSSLMIMPPVAMAEADDEGQTLTEKQINLYGQNSIFFYNPYGCTVGTTIPGKGNNAAYSGDWDGSCTAVTPVREEWLLKQIGGMQTAASANGLPWELIAAQAIAESGGGSSEVCPYNPLGLKGSGPSCNGRHRSFSSYAEAYDHYVNNIISVRKVKGVYPNDPYSAIAYMQYGSGAPYAQCSKEEYLTNPNHSCYGHNLGDPTPSYVNNVSSIICGIQKWAKTRGIPISSVTWENYSTSDDGSKESSDAEMEVGTGAAYCNGSGSGYYGGGGSSSESPMAGNLADFVRKWAWPNYEKGKTEQMPAYEQYMDTQATYKGDCNGNDCGAFVANIIKASGWDTGYPQCNTDCQRLWLPSNWVRVNPSSLRLGDVGIKPGHVILYVGNIPGFNSNTASASQCDRAPMAGADKNLNKYIWYRKR